MSPCLGLELGKRLGTQVGVPAFVREGALSAAWLSGGEGVAGL